MFKCTQDKMDGWMKGCKVERMNECFGAWIDEMIDCKTE